MDSSSSTNDPLCNGPIITNHSTSYIMIGACNTNSLGIIHPSHTLFNVNGSELNAGASLSDDSGVTLTTNSSISSGDSFQLDMCKNEIDLIKSDGDASFHYFGNCSVGGMSTENFNTLKRGPLAPIDPPLEFQDSPKTTLVRTVGNITCKTIKRWPMSSFEHPEEVADKLSPKDTYKYDNTPFKGTISANTVLHSSDSMLNTYTDNIYDEPNNIISTSLGNRIDVCESKSMSSLKTYVPNSGTHSICSFHNETNKCLQTGVTNQDHISTTQKFYFDGNLDRYKYELNCGTKSTLQYVSSSQRKILKNPPYNSYQYNGHHYTPGSCSCGNRAHSRNSLNSRLSSSHNSLCVPTSNKADDSIFITQAMSHDALLTREISDFYNVPIDSDIYAFPIDMITSKREYVHEEKGLSTSAKEINIIVQSNDHRFIKYNDKKNSSKNNRIKDGKQAHNGINKINIKTKKSKYHQNQIKQENALKANESIEHVFNEPLHMTLEEVKQFYQSLYSDTTEKTDRLKNIKNSVVSSTKDTKCSLKSNTDNANAHSLKNNTIANNLSTYKKLDCGTNIIYNNHVTISSHNNVQYQVSKVKDSDIICKVSHNHQTNQVIRSHIQLPATNSKQSLQPDKKSQFNLNLKQKLCSIFRFRKSVNRCVNSSTAGEYILHNDHSSQQMHTEDKKNKLQSRALPPLPILDTRRILSCGYIEQRPELQTYHFTTSIEKVKDYGWYWGPLSSEAAENILSNEPDGSFIVRDSSDDHYIFSLSFKLNSCVRHVRIEQDQGTFSFGSYAKFKSQTITEFIEKAVDHSRSGRYLFFLHRRPEHGPMRVQLTNPVSRFKHVQSLQHICRFVILKAVVRKDLIQTLPLPRRLLDYINYKHCYSEQVESDCSHFQITGGASNENA